MIGSHVPPLMVGDSGDCSRRGHGQTDDDDRLPH